jgi:hypothetical protein
LRDQVSLPVVAPIAPKKVSNSSVLNELERLEDVLRRT